MMIRGVKCASFSGAVILFLAGCAGLNTSRMVPEKTAAGPQIQQSIEIVSLSGGSTPTFGGPEMINDELFEDALHNALSSSRRFSKVGPNADLGLNAQILGQQQTSESLSYVGHISVLYEIRDSKTGDLVWRKRVDSSYMASALSGATRTVQAREGAVRKNLASFINSLAAWEGSDTVASLNEDTVTATLNSYEMGATTIEDFKRDFDGFVHVKEKDELFAGDIEIYPLLWSGRENQTLDAELMFFRVSDTPQAMHFNQRHIPLSLLVFESGVLIERIGPISGADDQLVSVADAVRDRKRRNDDKTDTSTLATLQGYQAGVTTIEQFTKDFPLSVFSPEIPGAGTIRIIHRTASSSFSGDLNKFSTALVSVRTLPPVTYPSANTVYIFGYRVRPNRYRANALLQFKEGILKKIDGPTPRIGRD